MTKYLSMRAPFVWALFEAEVSLRDYQRLAERARVSVRNFEFFPASMKAEDKDLTTHGKIEELDRWVSGEGSEVLADLVRNLQKRIIAVAEYALPAHDLRQILHKDVCEGLRFADFEQPQGYKSAFMIPMFCHDLGRLLEGKFYSLDLPMSEWIRHSELSFLMLREVLDEYPEIPERLKNHFLYAVLAHSGKNGETYMSRAVQTCDRMQMLGPEGFFRAISFMTGLVPGGELAYPRDKQYETELPILWHHKSVVSVMEHVGRNMYPNIGEAHQDWQTHMQLQNTGLLWQMGRISPRLRDRVFAPELGHVPETSLGAFKRKFSTAHMMAVRDLADKTACPMPGGGEQVPASMARYLRTVLENPYGSAKLTEPMQARILMAVKRANPEEMVYLAAGINYAVKGQRQLDREDNILLSKVIATPGISPMMRTIAEQAQQFANSGIVPLNLSSERNAPRFVL